jgi:hypothetical protein
MNQTGDPGPRSAGDGDNLLGDFRQKLPSYLWFTLLVELEEQVPRIITSIRGQVAGTEQAAGVADVIAAIVITRSMVDP